MDKTTVTGWWNCGGCGADAELPGVATAGCEVPCPDCGDAMAEEWQWVGAA